MVAGGSLWHFAPPLVSAAPPPSSMRAATLGAVIAVAVDVGRAFMTPAVSAVGEGALRAARLLAFFAWLAFGSTVFACASQTTFTNIAEATFWFRSGVVLLIKNKEPVVSEVPSRCRTSPTALPPFCPEGLRAPLVKKSISSRHCRSLTSPSKSLRVSLRVTLRCVAARRLLRPSGGSGGLASVASRSFVGVSSCPWRGEKNFVLFLRDFSAIFFEELTKKWLTTTMTTEGSGAQ